MKSLRIAMASHAYPYLEGSHAAQFVHELASTLVGLGHEVHAVIPSPSDECEDRLDGVHLEFYRAQDRVSYGRADDAYVERPKLAVAVSLAQAVRRLYQVVRDHDVDIMHAHWAVPMGFVGSVVKMVTGKPLVITTHGRDVYVDPEAGAIVPSLWYVRPFLQFALRRADRVIAVSQDCRHCAIRVGAPSERVEVIHNGVDAKRFSPNRVDGAGIRERIGVPDSAKLILFVGSLRSYKGIDILVQAMPRILESEPSAVTVVVGEGSQRETLVELKNSLGLEKRVVFVGRVPNWELAYYENACDVLVLPSRRESFGIAAVEAMACAKPVVGTRVGGLREIIDHGETGLLIDPDEPEELAESIVQVLGDRALAERLGSKARRKVEAKFNWLSAGLRTAVLYREILERTASND